MLPLLPPKPAPEFGPPPHSSDSEDTSRRASFFTRAAALSIDGLVVILLSQLFVLVFTKLTGDADTRAVLGLVYYKPLAAFLAYLATNVLPTAYTGQSVGKKLCRIRVVSTDDREQIGLSDALGRSVAHSLSAAVLFGYLLALGEQRRALHDLCIGTLVIKVEDA